MFATKSFNWYIKGIPFHLLPTDGCCIWTHTGEGRPLGVRVFQTNAMYDYLAVDKNGVRREVKSRMQRLCGSVAIADPLYQHKLHMSYHPPNAFNPMLAEIDSWE